jgi:hypothetical protein
MSDPAVPAPAHDDPLQAIADAMQTAAQAVKDGAADARAGANEALPKVSRLLSEVLYNASYAVAYGVVFPTCLIASAVPKNNALVYGLIDGGHAARDMARQMRREKEAAPVDAPVTED